MIASGWPPKHAAKVNKDRTYRTTINSEGHRFIISNDITNIHFKPIPPNHKHLHSHLQDKLFVISSICPFPGKSSIPTTMLTVHCLGQNYKILSRVHESITDWPHPRHSEPLQTRRYELISDRSTYYSHWGMLPVQMPGETNNLLLVMIPVWDVPRRNAIATCITA